MKCKKCDKEATHIWRCDEHYKCDVCGTREKLCYRDGLTCDKCFKEIIYKKIKEFDGDTESTDEIICPYCGCEFGNSYEYFEGDLDCDDCGNTFEMTREVSVYYYTHKRDDK